MTDTMQNTSNGTEEPGALSRTEEPGETLSPPMVRIGTVGFLTRRHAALCAVVLFLGSVPFGMVVTLLWVTYAAPRSSARRTIVIHQFRNLTTDAKQDSFCKGLGEELLGELNRKKPYSYDLVIGQDLPGNQAFENSSGKGLIFELEGSVRKEGHTLRIAIELNELRSKRVMWAELYEGNEENLVPVERDVATQIAKGILTRL